MDEKPFAVLLNRAISGVENFGVFIGCLLLWAIVALICAQIAMREIFSAGLPWIDELSRYFHIVLVGLGLGYVLRKGANVDMTLLVELLPARLQRVFARISTLAILLTSGFIVYGAIHLISRAGASKLPALGMEVRYFLLPTAIGFGILAIEALRQLVAHGPTRPSGSDSGEEGPA